MPKVTFFISPDGREIRFIQSDLIDLTRLSRDQDRITLSRASHVEPIQSGPDRNKFEADLRPVGGPILGPFTLRSEALAAEVVYLTSMLQSGQIHLQEKT